jgi:glycerol-3-phosphate dehydrogenase
MTEMVDLLVIGGGINGVGIANLAAQSGLKVMLVEQGDLAGATSSCSSKLIHGGLRYLEFYDFQLVRKALVEREILLGIAPHIIWPLNFVLPHHRGLRPKWLIRCGLFLYDNMGSRRALPKSTYLHLARHPFGDPLQAQFTSGFCYADCWVDDARLVVANAMQFHELGGDVRVGTRCVSASQSAGQWVVDLLGPDGQTAQVQARGLVNAAGPWVDGVLRECLGRASRDAVRLVKGSHIVVPKLHDGTQAYILQHSDQRIVFVLPYEDDFSLIGTTDLAFSGDLQAVAITPAELDYLCALVNQYFTRSISASDVVWSYAGVRPLFDDESDDPSAVTRDYVLRLESQDAPLLSVFGGKITTYRTLAIEAMRAIGPLLNAKPTSSLPTLLPGGEYGDMALMRTQAEVRWPWLPRDIQNRLLRTYGSRLADLIGSIGDMQGLGQDLGAGLFEAEVRYLVQTEWARQPDDVLWRRTKRGLHMSEAQRSDFATWFAATFPALMVGSKLR